MLKEKNKKNTNTVVYTGVFYTDGSCVMQDGVKVNNKSVGYGGSAFHGYLVRSDQRGIDDVIGVFYPTLTGYMTNHNLDGKVKVYRYVNGTRSYKEYITSNMAELYGIYIVLEYILSKIDRYKFDFCRIISDSSYSILMVTKAISNSISSNSKFENLELLLEIQHLVQKVQDAGIKVELIKVKGHSNNLGNELVDTLANNARKLSESTKQDDTIIKEYKQYWNLDNSNERNISGAKDISKDNHTNVVPKKYKPKKITRHPFLIGKNIVWFSSSTRFRNLSDGQLVFYIYNSSEYSLEIDTQFSFGLVCINTTEFLETAITRYINIYKGDVKLNRFPATIMYTDQLYSAETIEAYRNTPDTIFKDYNIFTEIMKVNRSIVMEPIVPQIYAITMYPISVIMESVLVNFRRYLVGDKHLYSYSEITVDYYKVDNSGRKPKSKLLLPLDVEEVDSLVKCRQYEFRTNLIIGVDIPEREILKKVEKHNPRVFVCYVTNKIGFAEYYTIIHTDKNETCIYSGLLSNYVDLDLAQKGYDWRKKYYNGKAV